METSDGGSPQLSAAHQQKNDVSATSGSAWMAGVGEGADPRHGDVQAIDEGKLEAAAVTAEQDVNAHENGEEEETADAEAGEEKEANPESLSDDGEGTTEEQAAFIKELDAFFRERNMEFEPPRFYGVELNCLKLWKAVMKLGGYKQVTAAKLWRQVGARFKPPITCATVSWSFRGFYVKALLKYEKYKTGATSDSEADDPFSRRLNEELHFR